ncbi:MAG TPA: preprotein translocase subunit YajC [Arenimonas sp.]|jgi:preprotein translocase subunit YajC|nr:preprotein translocase subunit YajC [Arenimonas sp.]HPW32640.1 preprotein translocase subunit YajC [Arenimonas sp.]
MSLLDFFISPAAAQSAAAPAAGGFGPLIMIAVMFVVMWFLMIRPQMKRQKEHRELISKLSKGDEIITSGGIAGRVDDLGDNFITVEIADNTKIKLQRNAITAVLPKGTLKSA